MVGGVSCVLCFPLCSGGVKGLLFVEYLSGVWRKLVNIRVSSM